VRVDVSPGHPARELGWDDIERKLADCAASAGLPASQAAAAFAALETLEGRPDVRGVVGHLTRP
jgi:hypothetical protein